MKKTYTGWKDEGFPQSEQKEYTEPVELLSKKGKLQAAGWARHTVFDYDRNNVKHTMRRKEWDFYQLSNGRYMVQISFANISLGGYASAVLVDLKERKTLSSEMGAFLGGKDKYILPKRGDVPGEVEFHPGDAVFRTVTEEPAAPFSLNAAACAANLRWTGFPDRKTSPPSCPSKNTPTGIF